MNSQINFFPSEITAVQNIFVLIFSEFELQTEKWLSISAIIINQNLIQKIFFDETGKCEEKFFY
jgi:hypothetical protein